MDVRSRRIRISSTTSGPRRSASSGLRHQLEQPRHGIDDPVGRASDVQPASIGRLRDAARVDPCRELCHARGIQVQHEAEIRILATGSNDLARDRQIDGEDEQVRGIVFEDFAAEHDDLRALRGDAERRAERRVHRLGAHPRQTDRVGPGKAKLKGTVMRACNSPADARGGGAPARPAHRG